MTNNDTKGRIRNPVVRALCWRSAGFVSFILLAWSGDAFAYRVEFLTTVDGTRRQGSEICLYEGVSIDSPAGMFLHSDEVHCLPADKIIDLPSGVWAFYARHPDGWISAHGSAITSRGNSASEQGYRALEVEMEPAAFIEFPKRDKDSRFVAYVPISGDPRHAPAAYPLPAREDVIMVPAGRPFVVFRVRDGRPLSTGPLTVLSPAQTIYGDHVAPAAGKRDLITWISVARSSLAAGTDFDGPLVHMIDERGREHVPIFTIAGAGSAHRSFVVFSDPPDGETVKLRLSGEIWRSYERELAIDESSIGFVDEPLIARLRQRMTIDWDFPGIDGASGSCENRENAEAAGNWTQDLSRCEDSGLDCRLIQSRNIEPRAHGTVIFDVPNPGTYRIRFVNSDSQTLGSAGPFEIQADRDVMPFLTSDSGQIFGTVSSSSIPVEAEIRFWTGKAVSDEFGRYEAFLSAPPGRNVIDIFPCDGSAPFHHLPEHPITTMGRYDIEIPDNEVIVRVMSEDSAEPLRDATVERGLFEERSEAKEAVLHGGAAADDAGRVVLQRLQPGHFLRICASAPEYESSCADPVRVTAEMQEEIEVRLAPHRKRSGRLTGFVPPILAGKLARTSAEGEIIEEIRVAEDGSFYFRGSEAASHLIFVSATHPLFVIRQPRIPIQGDWEVSAPIARLVDFMVVLSDDSRHRSGWFMLIVGEAVVPSQLFDAHITRRGSTSELSAGRPSHVRDVLATGPIRVIASLDVYPLPENLEELFTLPEYRGSLRVGEPNSDGVVEF